MLTKSYTAVFLSAMAMISLQGCAGGGGGGGGVTSPPVTSTPTAFTSWGAVQPNSTVKITGKSLVASFTGSGQLGTNFYVTGVSVPTSGSSDLLLTYDGSLNLTGVTLNTTNPTSSVSWQGSEISCSTYVCSTYNASSTGLAAGYAPNAFGTGWNYQTYGVWLTYTNSSQSGQVGAMSVGSLTPISGMPTSGTGTYTGLASGYYVDNSGTAYATAATMNATANFGGTSPSVSFSTTGTTIENVNSTVTSGASTLDMSGNLSIAAGTNSFSGTVNTSSGMTGTASGNFYGPSANEIGGTYSLSSGTSTNGQAMIGGFGGK